VNTNIPADFTLEDVRMLLESKPEMAEGYYTTKEWAGHLGLTLLKMRKLLNEALRIGKLDRKRVWRENLVGDMISRPGFKIILDKEENDGD